MHMPKPNLKWTLSLTAGPSTTTTKPEAKGPTTIPYEAVIPALAGAIALMEAEDPNCRIHSLKIVKKSATDPGTIRLYARVRPSAVKAAVRTSADFQALPPLASYD